MSTGRLYNLSETIATTRGRLYEVAASISVTKGRLYEVSASVPVPYAINAGADKTAFPFEEVVVTASSSNGTPAVWDFSTSPVVAGGGSGNSRTYTMPATMDGTTVTVTVTGSGPDHATGQDTMKIVVAPWPEWSAKGGQWRPHQRIDA